MNASSQKLMALVISAVLLASVSAFAGYWLAVRRGEHARPSVSAAATAANPAPRILYWYDPMQPSQHFDQPGKSPFMDMQLIPKYADEPTDAGTAGIQIDPAMMQKLGIRLTKVQRGPLAQRIDAVGSLGFNQRELAVVQARGNGFVTRVHARAPGDVIERGGPIVDLLIPEWTGAQTEYIALLKSPDTDLIEAARQRLVLLGMPSELIAAVERSRRPQLSLTIRSPLAGAIVTLDAREGMAISSVSTIASINGLGAVWLEAAIPEARAVDIAVGRQVKAQVTAFPAETFPARVIATLPQANAETRTLRIRIELANHDGRLRPGMFAKVELDGKSSEPVLYVESEALIRTGTRTVAIVATDAGHFIPTEVEIGADIGAETVVLRGLQEGQRVVSSGQFLIDSEANLKGVLARLEASHAPRETSDGTPENRP